MNIFKNIHKTVLYSGFALATVLGASQAQAVPLYRQLEQ